MNSALNFASDWVKSAVVRGTMYPLAACSFRPWLYMWVMAREPL